MDTSDNEQAAIWNGDAGNAWVEAQALLDHMFKPIEAMLVDAVSAERHQQVLDIGCGTGSTTIAASRRLGTKGHCVGVDISEQMIAMARTRAERESLTTTFLCADAQRHVFDPASFDLIISRFGVMFFNDAVAAFKNLRHAARKNAECRFIAWRGAEQNPFMTTAERAATTLLPHMPARDPDGPGQFAFARQERVSSILDESGWGAIHIAPVDVTCTFPESELIHYLTRMGPLGRVLNKMDEPTRKNVVEKVRAAFDPYVHGDEVSYTAACWNVSARAG
ncbi:MAG TPA: class I SAM-dependent methyltransferase [Herminiimonas sp.]|nr:class I SAM-dependent methyltransferase [Herminiimonas sp.]